MNRNSLELSKYEADQLRAMRAAERIKQASLRRSRFVRNSIVLLSLVTGFVFYLLWPTF